MTDSTVADYDLILLGSGPASGCAVACAEAGLRVAVIEPRPFGGTCALRGCNPKKVYTNAAALLDAAHNNAGKLLTHSEAARINWPQLHRFARSFTDPVPRLTKEKFQELGIAMYAAAGRFVGPNRIQAGPLILEGRQILIATGNIPTPLDFPGSEHVRSSDEFLELTDLPPRVTFIGGGYISIEFAHVVARTGRETRIVDSGVRPLKHFDSNLVEMLCKRSAQIGIILDRNAKPQQIEQLSGGGYRVSLERDGDGNGKTGSFETDLIVHGAGRVPNIADLNLTAGNVKSGKQGVTVDEFLRSVSNPAVFAAGDCADSGRPSLTPVASRDGKAVAKTILTGQGHLPGPKVVPSIVFTTPPLAMVGKTVEQAEKEGLDYQLKELDLSTKGEMRKLGEPIGGCHVLVDRNCDSILGAHLLCPHAEEIINLFALAMLQSLTCRQLTEIPFTYPSFTSEVLSALG